MYLSCFKSVKSLSHCNSCIWTEYVGLKSIILQCLLPCLSRFAKWQGGQRAHQPELIIARSLLLLLYYKWSLVPHLCLLKACELQSEVGVVEQRFDIPDTHVSYVLEGIFHWMIIDGLQYYYLNAYWLSQPHQNLSLYGEVYSVYKCCLVWTVWWKSLSQHKNHTLNGILWRNFLLTVIFSVKGISWQAVMTVSMDVLYWLDNDTEDCFVAIGSNKSRNTWSRYSIISMKFKLPVVVDYRRRITHKVRNR